MAKNNKNVEDTSDTAIAVVPKALRRNFSGVKEIIQTNLGANASLGFSDLTKVAMPAGGGTIWQVPTTSGKPRNVESIVGVIVGFQDAKSFWKDSIEETGGGSPPDCRSVDLVHGIGTPGILCSECPNNEFGSAAKGEGKACKDLRILYILTNDSILPYIIVVPPTSLKNVKKMFLGLAAEDEVPYFGALLSFSLVEDKNKAGIKYSKISIEKEALLDADDFQKAQAYKEMLEPMMNSMLAQVIEGKPTHEGDDTEEEYSDDDYVETEAEIIAPAEPEPAFEG